MYERKRSLIFVPFYFILVFFRAIFCLKRDLYRTLKGITGYYPNRFEIYELAFLHKSASLVTNDGIVLNNERLEFLGDSILDAVVSDYLYHKFPKEHEGFLTQMRSKIVNGTKLNELAVSTGIHNLVTTNVNNKRAKKHIYEDAFEAFIGAVYLDKGYNKTYKFIINTFFFFSILIK